MAQPATPNNTINYFLLFGGNNFNIAFHFRETPIPPATRYFNNSLQSHESDHNIKMSSRQAIFAFIVTVLLNLVQIKYQPKVESPFETRPKTMFVAIASLLLYSFFSYYARLVRTTASAASNHCTAAYFHHFAKISLGFCGPMSLASVISLLLPESLCPPVFSLSLLFSLSQLLPASQVRTIWNILIKAAIYIKEKFRGQPPHCALRRRGGGVQVQLPWLPQQAISNQVEILPV